MTTIFTEDDLNGLEKRFKINVINSAAGVKPAVLIGTRSAIGIDNLAIFSSLLHLGSNPPLMGFMVRPQGEVPRHTFQNILETTHYTINHVPLELWQKAHRTSEKFIEEISEFDACGFTRAAHADFHAPFVAESNLVLGMKFLEAMPITHNQTTLVIGRVVWLRTSQNLIGNDGLLNHSTHTGVSGANGYYSLNFIGEAAF